MIFELACLLTFIFGGFQKYYYLGCIPDHEIDTLGEGGEIQVSVFGKTSPNQASGNLLMGNLSLVMRGGPPYFPVGAEDDLSLLC